MKGPDRIDQAHGGIRGLVLVVAGNSGKPLLQKLGIKQGQKLAVLNPPLGYEIHLGRMPKGVTLAQELTGIGPDSTFCKRQGNPRKGISRAEGKD